MSRWHRRGAPSDLRNGRPVSSLATKLITSMWPSPNPGGLDGLPAAHPSTLADLFDQCHHALQALSGISQMPDEQQSHDVIRAVADSARSEFTTAYEQLGDLPDDVLVTELLDVLAATAIRVQSELDGTGTEPCFAEQIASGLLQTGEIDEFDAAVGARYLALEWDIDSAGAIALLESPTDES